MCSDSSRRLAGSYGLRLFPPFCACVNVQCVKESSLTGWLKICSVPGSAAAVLHFMICHSNKCMGPARQAVTKNSEVEPNSGSTHQGSSH